jgi:hypothetical protein
MTTKSLKLLHVAGYFALALALLLAPVFFAGPAFATTPTNINAQTPVGPYPTAVGAGALVISGTAADTTNGNSTALSGHEVLCATNSSGSTAYTITINSVPDQYNRTSDITAYSIAANTTACFSFIGVTKGWLQTDGTVHYQGSNVLILFTVYEVPR